MLPRVVAVALGTDARPSPTPALRHPGWRARQRRQRLGRLPTRILPAGPSPVTLLPRGAPGGARQRVRVRTSDNSASPADCSPSVNAGASPTTPIDPRDRMGRLREAAIRRSRTDPRLPQPLHPPDLHQQPVPVRPQRRPQRRRRALPLHQLPQQRHLPPQDHDAGGGRIHPPHAAAVLPPGFHRIRHYGFLANRARQQKLAECRRALRTPAPPPLQEARRDVARAVEMMRRHGPRRGPERDHGPSL